MKKRIVININDEICSNCEVNEEYCCRADEEIIDCIITTGKYKEEKIPETFDELCGLCKELNDKYYKKFMKNKIYLIEEDFIEFMGDDLYGFRINKDGTIESNDFDQIFKINQTVPQMWNFIKLIVGEII